MSLLIAIIVLTNIHSLASYSFKEPEPMLLKVGEVCRRDYECIKHAYCHERSVCECDSFYSHTIDNTACLPIVGKRCVDDDGCLMINNSLCRQTSCACKDDFVVDKQNSSHCLPRPKRVGESCQDHDECQESMGTYAFCIRGKCECFEEYVFSNDTMKCVKGRRSSVLYEDCNTNDDCLEIKVENQGHICQGGKCVCKEAAAWCSKGSILTPSIVTTSLLIYLIHAIFKQY
ncbi:latent-transforming growth factor beta-binding protein 1-like [Prorops nasuta]|uniref:latent-transforming growth factor beta-binding protein 1-like n=1 Tax=Prorops nasuta TaxID=863751 RepID=UPI0034CE6E65